MAAKNRHIAILGMGRVGTQLSRALQAAGHRVTEIRSHDVAEAARWAAEADLLLLCVQDERIAELNRTLRLAHPAAGGSACGCGEACGFGRVDGRDNGGNAASGCPAVAHISGATPLQAIADIAPQHGVFYCLQTFSHNIPVDFSRVPICIEASDEPTAALLEEVAQSLSKTVKRVSSNNRAVLHLAAVFASNYTNLMCHLSECIVKSRDLDFSLLCPLMELSAVKLQQLSPAVAQTGPALRGDTATMERHRQLLSELPLDADLATLYETLADWVKRLHDGANTMGKGANAGMCAAAETGASASVGAETSQHAAASKS